MPTRSRRQEKQYSKYRKSTRGKSCVFCQIEKGDEQFIDETKSFKVIINLFPYTYWDNQNIEHHIMVVPKKHTDTLSELSKDEALEYVKIISDYEMEGYNVWARAPQSTQKSIIHQHTHLLKPGKKVTRLLIFLRRPHLRLTKFKES